MREIAVLLILFYCLTFCGVKKFVKQQLQPLKHKQDSCVAINYKQLDTIAFDFKNIDKSELEDIFFSAVGKSLRKKDTVYRSKLLTYFGEITTNYFTKKKYKPQRKYKISSILRRALPYLNANFGILYYESFSIPISNYGAKPMYDKDDNRSPFNLYISTFLDKKKVLPLINQKEFRDKILKEFQKIDFIASNKMKSFNYIGFSYKLMKNRKTRIPSIRFFVYFGAKRLKIVEEKFGK